MFAFFFNFLIVTKKIFSRSPIKKNMKCILIKSKNKGYFFPQWIIMDWFLYLGYGNFPFQSNSSAYQYTNNVDDCCTPCVACVRNKSHSLSTVKQFLYMFEMNHKALVNVLRTLLIASWLLRVQVDTPTWSLITVQCSQ